MIYSIRSKDNKDLAEVEIYVKSDENKEKYIEINSSVNIKNYSMFLLNLLTSSKTPETVTAEFALCFDFISELRGWLWEVYFAVNKNEPECIKEVNVKVKELLDYISNKFELVVIED